MTNKSFLVMVMLIIAFASLSVIYPQDKTQTVLLDFSENDTTTEAFMIPQGYRLTGVSIPALEAATSSVTVMTSIDASNFNDLWYAGAAYSETITNTGINLTFEFTAIFNWEWYKLKFNVAQTADRTFTLQLTKK